MPIIKTGQNKHPQIPEDCCIGENATIVDEVSLGKEILVAVSQKSNLLSYFKLY